MPEKGVIRGMKTENKRWCERYASDLDKWVDYLLQEGAPQSNNTLLITRKQAYRIRMMQPTLKDLREIVNFKIGQIAQQKDLLEFAKGKR